MRQASNVRPEDNHYDLIVIGSGPAGEKAAVKAAYFGFRVALVERNQEMGGAGANTGTLPLKALKESALFYSGKYDTGLFGADRQLTGHASIRDFMCRKASVMEASSEEVRENLRRGIRSMSTRATGVSPALTVLLWKLAARARSCCRLLIS
jgi:pyruvate/2-oxoglutarate dehydrogenase complex dihydrolipoamide dehydrogenase (E3) component